MILRILMKGYKANTMIMDRRDFLRSVFLGVVGSSIVSRTLVAGAKKQRNVVVFLSDDQGYAELGSYLEMENVTRENLGADDADKYRAITKTGKTQAPVEVCIEAARKCMPNIDRLAKKGIKFSDFHAVPTCAPSRTALMTSTYPQRYGIYANIDVVHHGVPQQAKFMPEVFQDAGYMTGISGKWHLGSEKGQHPNDRGFDHYFGFDRAHTEKYGSKILERNSKKVKAKGWLADQITEEAIGFLKSAESAEKPFFLYVSYNEPHGPSPVPPKEYVDHFKSGSALVDNHFATIYGMDVGIGRIIKQIEDMGCADNTLLIYASDNGLAKGSYKGFRWNNFCCPVPGNGRLRGSKWMPLEGGHRVPFIAYMPGSTGNGKICDQIASIMDVMPTALDYAGLKVPDDIDGKSLMPVLNGNVDTTFRGELFWAGDAQPPFGIKGSAVYKELEKRFLDDLKNAKPRQKQNANPPAWYVRKGKWKLVGWDSIEPMLFDLKSDAAEKNDVAHLHPDVVSELKNDFNRWLKDKRKPLEYDLKHWNKLFQKCPKSGPKVDHFRTAF